MVVQVYYHFIVRVFVFKHAEHLAFEPTVFVVF